MTDPIHRATRGAIVVTALALSLVACGDKPAADAEAQPAADPAAEAGADSGASVLTLTPAAVAAGGIRSEVVRPAGGAGTTATLQAPGQVEADPLRAAFVSSRVGGRLERLLAVAGDRVTAGQVVAEVMSPAFLAAQQDLRQAARRATLLAGTPDSAGAVALAGAARRRLELMGVAGAELDRVERGGEPAALLPVTAPFDGSLVEAMTLAGAAVEPGTPIFRLIDLREVDIAADVPERYLPELRVGQRAVVRLAAYPDLALSGRVERIRDELDPTTRTIEALVHVSNPGRVLRPGMFATVELEVSDARGARAQSESPRVLVPAGAILSAGDERYLFVELAEGRYERRVVMLAPDDRRFAGVGAADVVVQAGVAPGDRVVVDGAFTLKSELAKAGFAEEE